MRSSLLATMRRLPSPRPRSANGSRRAGGDEGSGEHGNLIPIIQAAILGSILTNLLLCLGICFVVGGLRQTTQKFHAAVSEVGGRSPRGGLNHEVISDGASV